MVLAINFNLMIRSEHFILCDKIPSGAYEIKCTNIIFNDNILYALCPKTNPPNTFVFTQLNLDDCVGMNSNDCDSINIDLNGNLICE